MLPESKPPQDVVDLVNEYKSNPKTRELVIYDNLFYLYELTLSKDGDPDDYYNPTRVHRGNLLKRAYWRDAAGISLDMMKSRLGIR